MNSTIFEFQNFKMKKTTIIAGLLLSLSTLSFASDVNDISKGKKPFELSENVTEKDYIAQTIIFKVKSEYRSSCQNNSVAIEGLNKVLTQLNAKGLAKQFPHAQIPKQRFDRYGNKFSDITLIYEFKYEANVDLVTAINKVIKTGVVEYAEPHYIYALNYTPNDVKYNQQSWLGAINTTTAWDISQGDTNVVIGIVDSGTDIDHPDLKTQFKRNYNEIPNNSLDDDNDGYIDNYIGWDLAGADYENVVGDKDADIKGSNQAHGAAVSGDASAATDNTTGVAAPGFKCKLLPVKCGADNDTRGTGGVGYIITGYQGIVYAADHGAKIINCSWGGAGGAGDYGQDIIDYAVINNDAIVVAAAGNDNVATQHYPSGYNNVICVASTGGTTSLDYNKKSSFSNYGNYIDVSSPGSSIYSTDYNNTYGSADGTSMASPVCAGVLGLVRSHFPTYNAIQATEQLRSTCKNIDAQNTAYKFKLGAGLIDAQKALSGSLPSVRLKEVRITDNGDETYVANDTLYVTADFINYLAPAANVKVVMSYATTPTGSYVTLSNTTYNIGAMATEEVKNNNSAPFKVFIKPVTPANCLLTLRFTITDGTTYSSYDVYEVVINVDYLNVTVNQLKSTITSKGRIGYNNGVTQGIGMTYKDSALLYEGSLMIGVEGIVSDNIRNNDGGTDYDFKKIVAVKRLTTNTTSDFDLYGTFNDVNNAFSPLEVEVKHLEYAWATDPDDKYIIKRNIIYNKGNNTLSGLYAGYFCDYDVQANYDMNKGDEDQDLKLGYTYNTTSAGLYTGVKVLSATPFNYHASDNSSGVADDSIDVSNGVTDGEKYWLMVTPRSHGGGTGVGTDIIQTVSSGPFDLAPNDSIEVAFAFVVGEDLNEIKTVSSAAQTKYDLLFSPNAIATTETNKTFGINSITPNPAKNNTVIRFNNVAKENLTLEVYNVMGQRIIKTNTSNNGETTIDLSNLSSGNYIVKLSSDTKSDTQRLTVSK